MLNSRRNNSEALSARIMDNEDFDYDWEGLRVRYSSIYFNESVVERVRTVCYK